MCERGWGTARPTWGAPSGAWGGDHSLNVWFENKTPPLQDTRIALCQLGFPFRGPGSPGVPFLGFGFPDIQVSFFHAITICACTWTCPLQADEKYSVCERGWGTARPTWGPSSRAGVGDPSLIGNITPPLQDTRIAFYQLGFPFRGPGSPRGPFLGFRSTLGLLFLSPRPGPGPPFLHFY